MSSHNFLRGVLQSVQEAYPDLLDTQVLKTLFPSLFLALVARNTNIIIHTSSQPAELQKSTAKVGDHLWVSQISSRPYCAGSLHGIWSASQAR
jgi:hypothetical protein